MPPGDILRTSRTLDMRHLPLLLLVVPLVVVALATVTIHCFLGSHVGKCSFNRVVFQFSGVCSVTYAAVVLIGASLWLASH